MIMLEKVMIVSKQCNDTSTRKYIPPKDLVNPSLEVAHVARHTNHLAGHILQLFQNICLSRSRRGHQGHGG